MKRNVPMALEISLAGRVVAVTGAGQGIGEAVVDALLKAGAAVVAIDRNEQGLQSLSTRHADHPLRTYFGDVTDASFVQSVVDQAIGAFGKVDGLVNNAGISRAAMIEKMTAVQWQSVIDVNMTGVFNCTQTVGRHMIERSKAGDVQLGSIVNIGSEAGRRGSIGQINYAATKAAVFAMTMSTAREWSKYGIRINTVSPGGIVDTPMTETIRGEKFISKYLDNIPMGRVCTATEIAMPVCFLLSDLASYITGQSLAVNGGAHMNVG
jgi:3-oxoacyl-[acyl-carrier protein] reductase